LTTICKIQIQLKLILTSLHSGLHEMLTLIKRAQFLRTTIERIKELQLLRNFSLDTSYLRSTPIKCRWFFSLNVRSV